MTINAPGINYSEYNWSSYKGMVIKYRGGGAMEIEGWVMNFSSHK